MALLKVNRSPQFVTRQSRKIVELNFHFAQLALQLLVTTWVGDGSLRFLYLPKAVQELESHLHQRGDRLFIRLSHDCLSVVHLLSPSAGYFDSSLLPLTEASCWLSSQNRVFDVVYHKIHHYKRWVQFSVVLEHQR